MHFITLLLYPPACRCSAEQAVNVNESAGLGNLLTEILGWEIAVT